MALEKVCQDSTWLALEKLAAKHPFVVQTGLSHTDALIGQFELICCDIVSVFIPDEVIENAKPEYLQKLFASLLKSDEFSPTWLNIVSLPDNEHGEGFIKQFLGAKPETYPIRISVELKKARIMEHWGQKIGADVSMMTA